MKKLAKRLLARLPDLTTMDWQKTQQSRAKVQVAIKEALEEALPAGYDDAFPGEGERGVRPRTGWWREGLREAASLASDPRRAAEWEGSLPSDFRRAQAPLVSHASDSGRTSG